MRMSGDSAEDVYRLSCPKHMVWPKGQTKPLNRCFVVRISETKDSVLKCYLCFAFAYNSSIKASTRSSPFGPAYGLNPAGPLYRQYRLPDTEPPASMPLQAEVLLRRARREPVRAKTIQKRFADQRRRPSSPQVGDKVCLKVSYSPRTVFSGLKILSPRYEGPFKI